MALSSFAADSGKPEDKPDVSKSAQVEEVNVAAVARGARVAGGEKDTSNLLAMIDQTQGKPALLSPNGTSGASVSVIDLAAATEVSRIAFQVGTQKGRLRVVALEDEKAVEEAQQAGVAKGKLISEFVLDGTQNNLSLTLEKLTMKSVAVVWIPDSPGQPLAVSAVGIFTRSPPAEAALKTSAPAVTITGAEVRAEATPTPAPAAPPAPVGSNAMAGGNTASSSVTATASQTPVVPPQTRSISVP